VFSSGQADVSIVFTTYGEIELEQLMLLEDDKDMFPP
jgi:glycine betaine/choline ABC-type transport system substrate-binding protein